MPDLFMDAFCFRPSFLRFLRSFFGLFLPRERSLLQMPSLSLTFAMRCMISPSTSINDLDVIRSHNENARAWCTDNDSSMVIHPCILNSPHCALEPIRFPVFSANLIAFWHPLPPRAVRWLCHRRPFPMPFRIRQEIVSANCESAYPTTSSPSEG